MVEAHGAGNYPCCASFRKRGSIVARALTEQEKVRYPWASQITDYVPVGFWRRLALGCSGAGIGILVVGVLAIYVFSMHLHIRHGVPRGLVEWLVFGVSAALLAVGLSVGLVTAVTAWLRKARTALVWSIGAVLPPLLWLVAWLQLR